MSLLLEITKIVLELKKLNCEGCINNYCSKRDYDCLYDIYYFHKAIEQLGNKLDGIDVDQLLIEWLKK